MFTNQYEQQRQPVIDLFKRYVKNRKELRINLKLGDGLDDDGLKDPENEVKKLEDNKYLVAIVGESKSGKSCFINALLGKSILPTGILQCTSGITEITDTDNDRDHSKVYLKVKYGHSEELKLEFEGRLEEDISPLQEKLKVIAAIKEEYRSLPTFQLNQFLLDKKSVKITNEVVKKLCEDLLKDEHNNPHKLLPEKFKALVEEYLADYKDLSKIPVEISIGYPLEFKFSHIQIVDTPGVNARGGLETETLNYIGNANAVIFIHPLKNVASGSLERFFKKVPNPSYENIFMCLTHKAYQTNEEADVIVAEAKKLFPEIKPEERIVAVDSMLKLIHDELEKGESADALMDTDKEKEGLLAKYDRRHKHDATEIRKAVLADSNFNTVKDLLSTFSEYALKGQLERVINPVIKGYEEQQKIYDEQIRLIGWKDEFSKTPEQFDQEINKLKKLLGDYQLRLNDFSQQKSEKYTGRGSTVDITFSTMNKTYDVLLENADNEDQIRKHIIDFNDECEKEVIRLTTQLQKEYEAEMNRVGAEFKAEHQISPPKINLTSISEQAKKQAYEMITIPGDRVENTVIGGLWGVFLGFLIGGPIGALYGGTLYGCDGFLGSTPTTNVSQFNNQKYKDAFINEARKVIYPITNSMPQTISKLFDSYNNQFKEKLGIIIKERQNAYEQLKKDQETVKKLNQLDGEKKTVAKELEKINHVTTQLSST